MLDARSDKHRDGRKREHKSKSHRKERSRAKEASPERWKPDESPPLEPPRAKTWHQDAIPPPAALSEDLKPRKSAKDWGKGDPTEEVATPSHRPAFAADVHHSHEKGAEGHLKYNVPHDRPRDRDSRASGRSRDEGPGPSEQVR